MSGQINEIPKKRICVGLLAHVDVGKTTLSEGMLYTSGNIRTLGRVDNKDAFLDTYELERARGITIFSKQAVFTWKDIAVTLLDTPGHVDFSAEMERTLAVLDYAVLVVSGADGVQGHTVTLWRLLRRYRVPVFLFVNKMDQDGTDRGALLLQLQQKLDSGCVDFTVQEGEAFYDALAMCGEEALEQFLDNGCVGMPCIQQMIAERAVFPCFFGSALKLQGVEELLEALSDYTVMPQYGTAFAARVFKIARDGQGSRLTYLKITGGKLCVRTAICGKRADGSTWEEKVTQIRVYSGAKFQAVHEVCAGEVCAVAGLGETAAGEGLGAACDSPFPLLEPVLTYRILLPEGMDEARMLPKLRQLEEEEPQLHIVWDERLSQLLVQLMGEVQLEVLASMVKDRFGVDISFGPGRIVYKETIADCVEGVGHFEPLRHYAEVHLLLEPLPAGSGMQFVADCSEDILERNWQRLVLTHLAEREHRGVLTGAALTDIKITLITGRAHLKHTEGGDFRQATYRAVRQGLMQAQSVLLEPYYAFRLELPEAMVGRAMTDVEKMHGQLEPPTVEHGTAVLCGSAPVATMRGYQKEVTAYTKGHGQLQCTLKGYAPCHNADEVIAQSGYEPQGDLEHPSSSVFCAHGAGFVVEWYEVKDYMHVESPLAIKKSEDALFAEAAQKQKKHASVVDEWIGADEVDEILARTFGANVRDKSVPRKNAVRRKTRVYEAPPQTPPPVKKEQGTEYFLVDGYNVIFAWDELSALAQENIDGARGRLLDILCNYQAIRGCCLIVVFDAYRVEGHPTEYFDYHNIHVVYTREAETADQYIERFAHENGRKYKVTVATSDGLEQVIIRGQGCLLMSARELEKEVVQAAAHAHAQYVQNGQTGRNRPFEGLWEKTGLDKISNNR